jgi:benzaldehyde dehydrogenase (NAD)
VLRRAGQLIEQNAGDLRTWVVRETGAVPGLGDFAVGVATQECYEAAALAHRPQGEILQTNQPRLSLLRRQPVGVVGVISFTGASATGRRVAELGARHLKRVHLELGGNSALIVLDDADIDRAVSAGAWASFLHQGQICMTAGRHIVHESIFTQYADALAEHASHLPVGDPFTGQVALGPVIDERQRDKVHSLVTSTVDAGAHLAAGGTFDGLFYQPTVLTDVTTGMPAYDQEVFGPVAPVIRFSTPDEAVALASDSGYGLSLSILTGDAMRGLALAEQIPSGIVHINDQTVNDEAVAPFGGVKASGTGSRFGGAAANIEAFTETRWITMRGEPAQYPL